MQSGALVSRKPRIGDRWTQHAVPTPSPAVPGMPESMPTPPVIREAPSNAAPKCPIAKSGLPDVQGTKIPSSSLHGPHDAIWRERRDVSYPSPSSTSFLCPSSHSPPPMPRPTSSSSPTRFSHPCAILPFHICFIGWTIAMVPLSFFSRLENYIISYSTSV